MKTNSQKSKAPTETEVLSKSCDGLNVISIFESGRIVLRHRDEDGIIHVYVQNIPIVPEIIKATNDVESWRGAIIDLPAAFDKFFRPNSVIGLKRRLEDPTWDFVFMRAPCSPDELEIIIAQFPNAVLFFNESEVSCIKDYYLKFIHGKPIGSANNDL